MHIQAGRGAVVAHKEQGQPSGHMAAAWQQDLRWGGVIFHVCSLNRAVGTHLDKNCSQLDWSGALVLRPLCRVRILLCRILFWIILVGRW